MSATYPAGALLELQGSMTDAEFAAALGVERQTVHRWKSGRRQVAVAHADRLAVALGRHPGEIWPEWWRT